MQDLKSKLHPGKDPAKPVIFLARMVIECLSKGSMSEKDIKNAVLDRCKEAGIKSSNRGLIAGKICTFLMHDVRCLFAQYYYICPRSVLKYLDTDITC